MGRQLPLVTSVLAGGLVLAGAFAARIQAQTQAPRFPNEITAIRFNAGQSVVPYFEGWIRNADGTFDMVFGYFNRNHVQEFSIPPGADNKIEPGPADSGQPTYFLPRRQRYIFRRRVPADFGKQEVVWTITANGRTEKGYGSLIPPQEITERVVMTGGNYNPGHSDPNKPPALTVTTAQTVTVGSPLTLTALVVDDGLPKPRAVVAAPRPARTPGGFGAQVNSSGAGRPRGLTANWLQYAGPAKVTFDHTAPIPVANGQAVTTARFEAPGTYKLIASTNDGQLTTKVEVTVTVTGTFPAAQAPGAGNAAPVFEVDPSWPKPLPNNWTVGPVSGITVDARDHILIVQRGEAVRQAGGAPAPPVIEFDPAGTVVRTWGGPGDGYEWPEQVHGITIDDKDRVWISGNGAKDAHILAFTRDGKFLRQIGRSGKSGGSNDTQNLGHATQMRIDPKTNEVFVSDGENQNHRVIVFDADTGAYKRHWGAYGTKPDDTAATAKFDPNGPPPKQFGSAVHCLRIARDGLVYACDRSNNRFQIFRRDGTFVKELFIAKETTSATVWDIDFSPDQRFMYVADGGNQKVWLLLRDELQIIGSFGGRGAGPGQFATSLHDIVVDSKGNLYTGEAATGGRVQKFRVK